MMSKADHKPKVPPKPFVAADQGGDTPADLQRIAERNRLLVQTLEINAKQRHLESLQIGLTLEVNRLKASEVALMVDDLPGLRARLTEVNDQLQRLGKQRDWLVSTLAEIDGAPRPQADPSSERN